jgi:uncharacterized protein (TIGR02444 family)
MESAFWRFSLRFYALPGVAPACLKLQDEGGADVNLLLFLLFLADQRRLVTFEDIGLLDAAIAPWREEAVKPLRRLRRRLKEDIGAIPASTSETFRNRIKAVELEAERLQQAALEGASESLHFATAEARAEAAKANLASLARFLGGLPETPLKIVMQAFTDLPP